MRFRGMRDYLSPCDYLFRYVYENGVANHRVNPPLAAVTLIPSSVCLSMGVGIPPGALSNSFFATLHLTGMDGGFENESAIFGGESAEPGKASWLAGLD